MFNFLNCRNQQQQEPELNVQIQQQQIPEQQLQQQEGQLSPLCQQTQNIQLQNNFQFQQQEMPMQYQYQNNCLQLHQNRQSNKYLNLLKWNNHTEDLSKTLTAVIITVCDSSSYDKLFTKVPQESEAGTRVRVYQTSQSYIEDIIKAMKGEIDVQDETLKMLIEDMQKVDPSNIVVNWECCAGCSSDDWVMDVKQVFKNIRDLIDMKYFQMFSDFSLGSLTKHWNQDLLGPNPFIKVGRANSNQQIGFNKNELVKSESAQLAKVGDLSEGDTCAIKNSSYNFLYTLNKKSLDNRSYTADVLTVVFQADQQSTQQMCGENVCQIGKYSGPFGHVMLNFENGGKLLASSGHWVDLMDMSTTPDQLFRVAERDYGAEYANNLRENYMNCSNVQEQQQYVQMNAVQMVQQSAPCQNYQNRF